MDIIKIYKGIDFVNRYKSICEKHDDFSNRMEGNRAVLYEEILNRLHIKYKYFKKDSFFKLEDHIKDFKINLHFVLKNGIVEAFIYIEKGDDYLKPNGRFDFIPEELGVDFNRKIFNLPKYINENELEEIIKEILSIYEDFKSELLKQDTKDA